MPVVRRSGKMCLPTIDGYVYFCVQRLTRRTVTEHGRDVVKHCVSPYMRSFLTPHKREDYSSDVPRFSAALTRLPFDVERDSRVTPVGIVVIPEACTSPPWSTSLVHEMYYVLYEGMKRGSEQHFSIGDLSYCNLTSDEIERVMEETLEKFLWSQQSDIFLYD